MANLIFRPAWNLPSRSITPESIYQNRREFLHKMGMASAALLASPALVAAQEKSATKASGLYPAKRNPEFAPNWPLTKEEVAATYNNFYEFSLDKAKVRELVSGFKISPWSIEITGLVDKPMKIDFDELLKIAPLEERVYRFRCVEAWGMIVPWTGFPLSKLIEKVAPKAEAKFVRFISANVPEQMPGIAKLPRYPWPYFEGLRMDEAMHPLTMLATGIYGKPLAKQFGAPVRLVVPWKYGYKSAKSIVKIEFVDQQPTTFWEKLAPDEYPFESNVNPAVPHPRWSQATERMIDTGDRVKTQPYAGYGDHVAKLYKS